MRLRRERWLRRCAVGLLIAACGCGGSDEGTLVKVDKAQDEAITKAMGDYMNKRNAPKRPAKPAARP